VLRLLQIGSSVATLGPARGSCKRPQMITIICHVRTIKLQLHFDRQNFVCGYSSPSQSPDESVYRVQCIKVLITFELASLNNKICQIATEVATWQQQ